jgi:antitoxin (DNA-binding transcriptional repressor) of toxin-antitoxin stability system
MRVTSLSAMVVTVRALRRNIADFAAKAAAGETIVIVRHGRPWALLRPSMPNERGRSQSITSFRDGLRRGLLTARRRPLRLTWRDEALAVVVCAVPRDLVLQDDES